MSRHLIVFAKTPESGRVKTRLTPAVIPQEAAALARAFLLDVLALGERVADSELTLAYTPLGTREDMAALAGDRWRLRLQRGADLGERMAHVFRDLLGGPGNSVVIIGSDSPQIPVERLQEAFAALERTDLVIGPCEDGGYYLIGLRRWVSGLFDGVRWSTDFAFADTVANANTLGLARVVLENDYDVDDPESLRRLGRDLHRLPVRRAPHTRAELVRQGRWDRTS